MAWCAGGMSHIRPSADFNRIGGAMRFVPGLAGRMFWGRRGVNRVPSGDPSTAA